MGKFNTVGGAYTPDGDYDLPEVGVFSEIPDHPFESGVAVQMLNDIERAIGIVKLLADHNIVSYASPPSGVFSARILIPQTEASLAYLLLPNSWVLIYLPRGRAQFRAKVYDSFEFSQRFLKAGDPLPDYLTF